MRLLLDTNVFIMLVEDDGRLPGPIREVLALPDSDTFLSTVSLWEIAIKTRLGKLRLGLPVAKIISGMPRWRVALLPLTAEHSIADPQLSREVRDPFDRMIAAVTELEQLALLTVDRALVDHPLAWRP